MDGAFDVEAIDRAGGLVPPGAAGGALAVSVLGRFEVRCGADVVAVPPGLPAQGVKFVAASGGRVHVEALIDALWPASTADEGRKGVRNLLARLGRAGCPVLVRDGAAIGVAEGAAVDALVFQVAADRVLLDPGRPGAAAAARVALARYRGDLLPDDLYADWAVGPRQRLRRRRVALLDLLAADARRRGATMEAVNLLELAIEAEPHDDVRYLQVAELLLDAGRRGRAAAFLDRSRQVLGEHGLLPGADWVRLQHRLRERRRPAGHLVAGDR